MEKDYLKKFIDLGEEGISGLRPAFGPRGG